jgi:hypothetical protein
LRAMFCGRAQILQTLSILKIFFIMIVKCKKKKNGSFDLRGAQTILKFDTE